MKRLEAGDVLSYSSGSTQGGARGYRHVRADRMLLEACGARWPRLIEALGGKPPLVISAYPGHLGRFAFGIVVDSYLSPRTVSRSLQLAVLEEHAVVLIGQPLFVADALWRHLRAGLQLPEQLILAVAGYVMPRSLESALDSACAACGCRLQVVHFYGVAEVEAGCLVAMERNAEGELVYHPTGPEIGVDIDGSNLLLSLRDTSGAPIVERHVTGDSARRCDEGFVIWNHGRASPRILGELEGWSAEHWLRRTGYLRSGRGPTFQLREHASAGRADELSFFAFAERFGFSWLEKPDWSGRK